MKPSQSKRALTLRNWAVRLAQCLLGATVGCAFITLLDAQWATGNLTNALSIYLADLGIVLPLMWIIGLLVGCCSIFVHPEQAASPTSLIASLRLKAVGRPADIAAFVPLVVLAAFFWMTFTAHAARALLAIEAEALVVGMAIAAAGLGIGLLEALVVFALTPQLRRMLATASANYRASVDPAVTGAVALVVAIFLFAFGIFTGGVSGETGLFGIWGVLSRPELDLRAPLMLVFIALIAFLAQIQRRIPAILAVLFSLMPFAFTVHAARALNANTDVAQTLERSAPLGGKNLSLLRRLTDRDGDGASAYFGGGDCNDQNAAINPLAREIIDDGIDNDCTGGDLTSDLLAKTAPAPSTPKAATKTTLPPDLNVVLITIDTLRWDIGYAGAQNPVSPNIDALAARSTIFEKAYSLASYTGKSIGPMMIGKYGSETHRNWGHFNTFSEEDTFVSERLKRAGVHTMSVHGHRYFGKFGGLDRGFDVVDLSAAPPEGARWDIDNKATSPSLTDAALSLLEKPEHTQNRFFLWVHYLDPHADYLIHDDVPSFGKSQRDLYDGEIAFTDKHIGRLLDFINKASWGPKTAIIITSDHGEAFGEHKMYRHGFELWEVLVRVPLVVHIPNSKPSRVSARRSLIDLVPTILEVMKVPGPEAGKAAGADFLSGTSLLPDVFLPSGETAAVRDILMDMPAGPYNDARRSLIHDDMKLTISNGVRFELYDLNQDPEEKNNLAETPAGKDIKDYYATFKARLQEIVVTGKRK